MSAEDPRGCGDDRGSAASDRCLSGRPPRVRGRHRDLGFGCAQVGRPPRVRGRRPTRLRLPRAGRKTPAGAGTTGPGHSRPPATAEDPRGCGDDGIGAGRSWPAEGRPPRVRGRHAVGGLDDVVERKTPAGAGTTPTIWAVRCGCREDPRGCGDDRSARSARTCAYGRPPRVRGRRHPASSIRSFRRKTPAGAGTTHPPLAPMTCGREDPRGCGDDGQSSAMTWPRTGRPPRVRGRPVGQRLAAPQTGKTPAGAGTTEGLPRRRGGAWEDPRGCGDDRAGVGVPPPGWGRPPRVRGRPWSPASERARPRKTPAGAGTTPARSPDFASGAEDPRGCGDDKFRFIDVRSTRGRPPRVRGRPARRRAARCLDRKTPAGAGTTSSGRCPTATPPEDPRGCGDDG
mgnify:CR=1 FL=1